MCVLMPFHNPIFATHNLILTDASIDDSKSTHTINTKLWINNRPWICWWSHLIRTWHVINGHGILFDWKFKKKKWRVIEWNAKVNCREIASNRVSTYQHIPNTRLSCVANVCSLVTVSNDTVIRIFSMHVFRKRQWLLLPLLASHAHHPGGLSSCGTTMDIAMDFSKLFWWNHLKLCTRNGRQFIEN